MIPSTLVRLKREENGRRAVYAAASIGAGDTIEIAAVLVLPARDRAALEGTELEACIRPWPEEGAIALALGYSCFYGRSATPNATWEPLPEPRAVRIFATRPIADGELITVC
ncbi:MAG: hypothetical protein EXR51_01520 [Dehalococcoidia bacterium]|nr:hypothetical protein [Dehalococcoidia bacterium]